MKIQNYEIKETKIAPKENNEIILMIKDPSLP